MEYYTAIERNATLAFVTTWMDPEDIMLMKTETEKDEDHMISLICGLYRTK